MSILIVGANGSMGTRYQAILNYLGKPFEVADKEHNRHYIKDLAAKCEGAIIATPTDTHLGYIRDLLPLKKPILCEKPVSKDIPLLKSVLGEIKESGAPFRMMYQYKMLASANSIGRSFYNYYRHGSDGLIWDCIQIIGLARGQLSLGGSSPIWRCMLNGRALNIAHMDAAYVGYVQTWLSKPAQDLGEILAVHERTAESEKVGVMNG